MSQGKMIIQAFKVKAALGRLARAKENAIRAMAGLPPIRPWYEECYIGCMQGLKSLCCKVFCPCCVRPSRPKLKRIPTNCCSRMFTADTYENECLKNFLGFFSGIILSFLLYLIMALQMKLPLVTASAISSGLGLVFSLGLAFSETFRCLVLLMLPSFCSSKGRTFLLMYATILILNHPVANFNHNILVMSESATCGQSLAANETKKLIAEALSPLSAILDGVRNMVKAIKRFADTIQKAFQALKRAVDEVANAIGTALKWLKSLVTVCNHNMGAPYRRCMKSFDDAIKDCRDRLGLMKFLCEIVDWVSNVCHIARAGEAFCIITSAIVDSATNAIGKPAKKILDNIHEMFYFNITLNADYNLTMTMSKSYEDVKKDIMNEIKGALRRVNDVITIADHVMMITVVLVLIKAIVYRYKYISKDRYDNTYITQYVDRIDERRQELGRETIFPLATEESKKYGRASVLRLQKNEKIKLAKGLALWVFAAGHGVFYILSDYGLYWVLSLIRSHFEVKTTAAVPPHTKLHVQGEGPMADMYRALISVLDPITADNLGIDTSPCLPNPAVPNFKIYETVLAIYVICLLMSVFESYALRLRHVIAACYHPRREEQRAVWLYNHILRTRGGFLKFARRQIRRKYTQNQDIQKASIRAQLAARYPLIGKILKAFGFEQKFCLLCGKEGRKSDYDNFIECDTVDCGAVYCLDCYDDLQNICTACMNPVDYGDASDVSEERDSSEDEEEKRERMERSVEKKERQARKREEQRASRLLLNFRDTLNLEAEQEDHSYQYRKSLVNDDAEDVLEELRSKVKDMAARPDYVSTDIFESSESDWESWSEHSFTTDTFYSAGYDDQGVQQIENIT